MINRQVYLHLSSIFLIAYKMTSFINLTQILPMHLILYLSASVMSSTYSLHSYLIHKSFPLSPTSSNYPLLLSDPKTLLVRMDPKREIVFSTILHLSLHSLSYEDISSISPVQNSISKFCLLNA